MEQLETLCGFSFLVFYLLSALGAQVLDVRAQEADGGAGRGGGRGEGTCTLNSHALHLFFYCNHRDLTV